VPREQTGSEMASLLDAFGLIAPTTRAVVTTGAQVATWAERQVLGALRARLDLAAPQGPPPLVLGGADAGQGPEPLRRKMGRLLDRALEQSSRSGQQELFHRIVDQLVPDEARIIGALSDGSVSVMLHVFARTVTGSGREPILENAALVGKTANVSVPRLTPVYVGHLLALGLLEVGPEDPALKDDYQILGADSAVLRALQQGRRGLIEARVERATIRLSALGRDLWEAATSGALS
jgi:hypothetical protein